MAAKPHPKAGRRNGQAAEDPHGRPQRRLKGRAGSRFAVGAWRGGQLGRRRQLQGHERSFLKSGD